MGLLDRLFGKRVTPNEIRTELANPKPSSSPSSAAPASSQPSARPVSPDVNAVPQIVCPSCGISMAYTRAACPQCKQRMGGPTTFVRNPIVQRTEKAKTIWTDQEMVAKLVELAGYYATGGLSENNPGLIGEVMEIGRALDRRGGISEMRRIFSMGGCPTDC